MTPIGRWTGRPNALLKMGSSMTSSVSGVFAASRRSGGSCRARSHILLALLLGVACIPRVAFSESHDSGYPILLQQTPVLPGAMWYSARLSVPKGRAYWLEITARLGAPELTSACLHIKAYGDTWRVGGQYTVWQKNFNSNRTGRYAVVTIEPRTFTNHPVLPSDAPDPQLPGPETIREGTEHEDRAGKASTVTVGTRNGNTGEEGEDLQDVVIFCTADVPILSSRVALRAESDVKLLKESWGLGGTSAFREWDFAGGVYAHAGDRYVAPSGSVAWEGLAMAGGAKSVRFRKRAVGLFGAGLQAPLGFAPALLSWQAPDGETTRTGVSPAYLGPSAPAREWSVESSDRWLPGMSPGRYTFIVEEYAMARGLADASASSLATQGQAYVILATADADFPACIVLPVRAKAKDGHPICG